MICWQATYTWLVTYHSWVMTRWQETRGVWGDELSLMPGWLNNKFGGTAAISLAVSSVNISLRWNLLSPFLLSLSHVRPWWVEFGIGCSSAVLLPGIHPRWVVSFPGTWSRLFWFLFWFSVDCICFSLWFPSFPSSFLLFSSGMASIFVPSIFVPRIVLVTCSSRLALLSEWVFIPRTSWASYCRPLWCYPISVV